MRRNLFKKTSTTLRRSQTHIFNPKFSDNDIVNGTVDVLPSVDLAISKTTSSHFWQCTISL